MEKHHSVRTRMITETEVPAGYVLSGETKVVRVDAAQHQTVTFGNLPNLYWLMTTKPGEG